jgi:NADH-quinone oxidoreductase subunit A
MLAEYLPILIFLAVAGAIGTLLLVLGFVFGPRRPDPESSPPTSAVSRLSRIRA